MDKVVMVKVANGHNVFEVLDDIRTIGFQFDHLLPVATDGMLIVGKMEVSDILLLKCFDGVESFRTRFGFRLI